MKELDVFTAKDLRTAQRVIEALKQNDLPQEKLFEFNKFVMDKREEAEVALREPPKTGRKSSDPRRAAKKKVAPPLQPGETELTMLRCTCGGQVLIEGHCGKQIATTGIVRTGICMECSKVFNIR